MFTSDNEITGMLRMPNRKNLFTPENDLKKNITFIRDTLKVSKKFTKSKILYGGSVNLKNIKNLWESIILMVFWLVEHQQMKKYLLI